MTTTEAIRHLLKLGWHPKTIAFVLDVRLERVLEVRSELL